MTQKPSPDGVSFLLYVSTWGHNPDPAMGVVDLSIHDIHELLELMSKLRNPDVLAQFKDGARLTATIPDARPYFLTFPEFEEFWEDLAADEVMAIVRNIVQEEADSFGYMVAPGSVRRPDSKSHIKFHPGKDTTLTTTPSGVYWRTSRPPGTTTSIQESQLLEALVWIGSPEESRSALERLAAEHPEVVVKLMSEKVQLPGSPGTKPNIHLSEEALSLLLASTTREVREWALMAADRLQSERSTSKPKGRTR